MFNNVYICVVATRSMWKSTCDLVKQLCHCRSFKMGFDEFPSQNKWWFCTWAGFPTQARLQRMHSYPHRYQQSKKQPQLVNEWPAMVTSPPNSTKYIQQILNLNKQGKMNKQKTTTTTKQIPGRLRIMLVLQNLDISLYPDEICRQTDSPWSLHYLGIIFWAALASSGWKASYLERLIRNTWIQHVSLIPKILTASNNSQSKTPKGIASC